MFAGAKPVSRIFVKTIMSNHTSLKETQGNSELCLDVCCSMLQHLVSLCTYGKMAVIQCMMQSFLVTLNSFRLPKSIHIMLRLQRHTKDLQLHQAKAMMAFHLGH